MIRHDVDTSFFELFIPTSSDILCIWIFGQDVGSSRHHAHVPLAIGNWQLAIGSCRVIASSCLLLSPNKRSTICIEQTHDNGLRRVP